MLAFFAASTLAARGASPSTHGVEFPALKSFGPAENFGANIQRTMTLLATSTAERRRSVRILFYGQSITEQDWWKAVARDLRQRFPHADLQIENRAIGGFSTQLLVKTAETDLYPFYPDLVILHVYGSHLDYESILRGIRSRTTAEVLIQTDHLAAEDSLDEPTAADSLTPAQWTPWMNTCFLPSSADKYRLGLVNQREVWKQYLRDYDLEPSALLTDGAHLNERGCFVMAQIVSAYLRHRPELSDVPWRETVRDYAVGRDVHWQDRKLTLKFDGNRIDAVLQASAGPPATVRIDGKAPSQFPELYVRTPATPFPDSKWPCLLKSSNNVPLELEEWTVTLFDVAADMSAFKFRVSGSKTGADGEGQSDAPFVSKSGRVVIDPDDWNFDYAWKIFHRRAPEGFQVRWRVVPQFVDELLAPVDVDPRTETAVTIAQGLPPGPHTLEITGGSQTPIASLRVYRPPFADGASQSPRSAARNAQ